ncbi:MAG: aldo/keto reductase [Planctomycetota bacterium]
MQYRRFGRTELQMPVISTGGMRYQDGWKDKPLSEVDPEKHKNMEATIARSIEVGINHIETARGYGVSERQLGVILPKYPRQDLIVQTKVGPDADPEVFVKNFHESLERLQLDYVDLLGLHGLNNAETVEWAVRDGGCFQAALELKKQGKVRHIGFSTHGSVGEILSAIEGADRHGGFDYINLHYYYIFQRNWPVIEAATKRDMGVFIISPSQKGGDLFAPPDKLAKLCEPLHPLEFNDLWCLRHPEIHTLSLGAAKPSDYDMHLSALAKMEQAAEHLPGIEARLEAAMKDAIGFTHPEGMSWNGVPEHYDTPGGHNLPIMLWLYNLARGWDLDKYAKSRMNLMGNAGHWFPGEKTGEFAKITDEQLAAAVKDSPVADQIPGLLRAAVERLGGEEVKRQSESD